MTMARADRLDPIAPHRFVAAFSLSGRGRAPAFVTRLGGGYVEIVLPEGRSRSYRKKRVRRFTRLTLRRPLTAEAGLSTWWEDGRPLDAVVVLLRGDRPAAAWRLTGIRPTRLATSPLFAGAEGPVIETLEARCKTSGRVAIVGPGRVDLTSALAAATKHEEGADG